MTYRIALVGGTGPEGRGLAARFAIAGHEVVLGSRDAARAASVAAELAATLATSGHPNVRLSGDANPEAVAGSEVVILVVPYQAHADTVTGLAEALAGKVVVDAVVPMYFERGARPIEVPEGSAAEQAAGLLPDAKVIGAFHNLAAEALLHVASPVGADVVVTGNDAEAKALVSALAQEIEGVRAVDGGPLRFTRFVEGLTVLLAGINGRYKAHTAVRIEGLPDTAPEVASA